MDGIEALFCLQEGVGAGIVRAFQGTLLMAGGLLPKEHNPLHIQQGLRDSGLLEENCSLAEAISSFQDGLQSLVRVTFSSAVSTWALFCHLDAGNDGAQKTCMNWSSLNSGW